MKYIFLYRVGDYKPSAGICATVLPQALPVEPVCSPTATALSCCRPPEVIIWEIPIKDAKNNVLSVST